MQIETNIDYPWPATECHGVLKEDIFPNFSLTYRVGYHSFALPCGTVGLSIVEEEERACLIKARILFRALGLIPYAMGPVLKIISRRTAETRCSVEMIAESTAYYDSWLANSFFDIINEVHPGMYIYKYKSSPKIFFGKDIVYDHENFSKSKASQDMNVRAYKLIFKHLHNQLAARIKSTGN